MCPEPDSPPPGDRREGPPPASAERPKTDESTDLAGSITDQRSIAWDSVTGGESEGSGPVAGYRRLESVVEAFRSWREGAAPATEAAPSMRTWGPLELRRELGRGGFGTVYEAYDPSLARGVALKLLREGSGVAAERFLEEGRRLARVRHPHVLTVHGAAVHDGRPGLWADRIEGSTLHDWVGEHGPLGPGEAASVGVDVCRALAAIHAAGLIHGDVKPSNVMREVGGRIVVMDFGAARDVGGAVGEPVEGTPAVVAPEVLAGEAPTVACDLYSVGVLLYFLLTGRLPIQAETCRSVRRAHEHGTRSPLSDVRPDLPVELVEVVERALAPEPRLRYKSAGEMGRALSASVGVGGRSAGRTGRPWASPGWAVAVAVLIGVALVSLALSGLVTRTAQPSPVRFELASDDLDWGGPLEVNLAVHPGGDSWVYRGRGADGAMLLLRRLDAEKAEPVAGTEGGSNPFWSPDGGVLGFTLGDSIRRVDPAAGVARTVLSAEGSRIFGTPSWGPGGFILYAATAPEGPGIYRVDADGGAPQKVLGRDELPGFSYFGWPRFLPDGEHFLLVGGSGDTGPQLYLASLGGEPPIELPEIASRGIPVDPDLLLFVRDGRLLVQRLATDGTLSGEAMVLSEGVSRYQRTGAAAFAAAGDLLVVARNELWNRMQWFDARGTPGATLGAPGDVSGARISPDGTRVAVSVAEVPGGVEDLWVFDLARGVGERLTSTPWEEGLPVWSPGGGHLAFYSDRTGPPDVCVRPSHPGGEVEVLVHGPRVSSPTDWSPDGREIIFEQGFGGNADLWLAPLDGGAPRVWLAARGEQNEARWSPDGLWIAFTSAELGRSEIFVAPSADSGRRERVSTRGGRDARWSPEGDELFYHEGRSLYGVGFDPAVGRVRGQPREILRLEPPGLVYDFDVTPDGTRFLVLVLDEERLRPRTAVQVGWRESLE